jgi:predicted permease
LRSLPYQAPERLVALTDVHVRQGDSGVGQENFRDWQAANTVFERMAFTEFSQVTLTGYGDAERITGRSVSEGFFEMMGVAPQLGRWFTPEEQRPGAAQVVMLSHRFWARKLGLRPDVVGSTLVANGRPYRIVGVMPESFRFNEGVLPEYWTPIAYRNHGRQNHQYAAYARLKPGVSLAAAQAQMTEIARRLEQAYPDNAGWGVRVRSLRARLLELLGPALAIFGAAALIVLLVACGNVASLLLARGIGRSREVAVRLALGAGRAAVVRLLLAEGLLLSGLAAAAGIGLAAWLLRAAELAAPPWLELSAVVRVTPSLAAVAVGLTIATGLLTGLWPALRASRADVQNGLKEIGGGVSGGLRQTRSLHALVAGEIALAVVLLTFAGLLTKSFATLIHTSLGYRTDRVLTFRMPLPGSRYKTEEARLQFWDRLLAELAVLPGVVSAAAADGVPMGGTYGGTPVTVEGDTTHRDWVDVMTRDAYVSPDYFRTLGIGLRAGRGFDGGDGPQSEPVAIVNETFARKLLPGRAAVGARVRLGGNDTWIRIVGVIGDTRYNGPVREAGPEVYRPHTQDPYLQFVAVRTAVPEQAVMASVRKVVRRLDPELAITQVRTMRESVDLATQLQRQMMALVGGFAAVTLALATLGLGGVMAYLVSRRRREIGLRMALGAARGDIARNVMGQAARLVAIGAALGVAGALAGSRLLESLLFGVKPRDPAVAIAAPLLLAAAALAACMLPARRAAAVEPMAALRDE